MPRQMTLMFLNLLLTVFLMTALGLHLDGWRWWFPCLWFVGMAAGSLWNGLRRAVVAAQAQPRPRGESFAAAGAASPR